MARYCDAVCRLCRREGEKLFLKGAKCYGPSCPVAKRETPPGMHQWRRSKVSTYGTQLREKQKLKRAYGILERQFRRYYHMAERQKGNTGANLLVIMERRLDNVLTRAGFGVSRAQARQLVVHDHVSINGHRANIPSALVEVGDVIRIKARPPVQKLVSSNIEQTKGHEPIAWIKVNPEAMEVIVERLPNREEVSFTIREQLIVELLSK